MKTKSKTIMLLAAFIASQILWSCSPLKMAHIEKRHYMDGYYIDINKGNNNIKTTLTERKSIDNALAIATVTEQKKEDQTIQYAEELATASKKTNKQDVASRQIVSGRNNNTLPNGKKIINTIETIKHSIKKEIKETFALKSNMKSTNTEKDVKVNWALFWIGGVVAVIGLIIGAAEISTILGLVAFFGGGALFIIGVATPSQEQSKPKPEYEQEYKQEYNLETITLPKDTLVLKKRIAVLEFANKAGSQSIEHGYSSIGYSSGQEVSANLTDMLITELVKTGRFIVLERSRINAILNEQKFDASQGVTAQSVVEINKLLGVQMIITGSITEFALKSEKKGGNYGYVSTSSTVQTARVGVDLRMVNASTGEITLAERAVSEEKAKAGGTSVGGFGSGSSTVDLTILDKAKRSAISKCVGLVAQAMDNVSWEGTVIRVNTDQTLMMKPGSSGGVKTGMKFIVYSKGTEVIDPETGLSLGFETKKIGYIEVTKDFGQGKACTAKILTGQGYKQGDIVKAEK
ncbi:MAG: CsgG/HfaB family protein [Bacteroidota bacterium]